MLGRMVPIPRLYVNDSNGGQGICFLSFWLERKESLKQISDLREPLRSLSGEVRNVLDVPRTSETTCPVETDGVEVQAVEPETMTSTLDVSGRRLKPPRAAAIAGVIFSVLMMVALAIIRIAVPTNRAGSSTWLADPGKRNALSFAINLVPFAGVAFLWFMGVLRNRLGKLEDQFFATVFFGSGLLFVASLFSASAIAEACFHNTDAGTSRATSDAFLFVWTAQSFLNVFAIKMAAVFMFSTSAIALRTAILKRWVAYSGFACGLVLLLIIASWKWIQLIFPLWMLLVSTQILVADLRRSTVGNL